MFHSFLRLLSVGPTVRLLSVHRFAASLDAAGPPTPYLASGYRPVQVLGQTSAISNRRSATWNILNPISLSIPALPIDKDIDLTMFQIADRRLLIAVSRP